MQAPTCCTRVQTAKEWSVVALSEVRKSHMADITLERTGTLVQQLMQNLQAHPDGMRARDAIRELGDTVGLTEYERGDYKDGLQRFPRIVRFATIDLVKAGWLRKERGYWFVTDEGIEALNNHHDPTDLYRSAKSLYAQWRKDNPNDGDPTSSTIEISESEVELPESDSSIESTLEDAEGEAWDQIREHISKMDPFEFQNLIAALLTGMGYHIAWKSPPGPDKGLDILAYTDPLGASGPRIKVQVKRRQDKAPAESIRSFMAILGDKDIGLYVCTGGFTSSAESEVRDQQTRRLTLMDASQMVQLWIEHYDRVPEEHRLLLPLRPIYFLDRSLIDGS